MQVPDVPIRDAAQETVPVALHITVIATDDGIMAITIHMAANSAAMIAAASLNTHNEF